MRETAMQSQNKGSSWLNIAKDFNTMTWVLMPVAIAINMAVGQIVATLRLPVYLDSIGTVLVGVICGPWAGALTGALANTILGLTINPDFLPWWPVAAIIGLVSGICANYGLFKSIALSPLAAKLCSRSWSCAPMREWPNTGPVSSLGVVGKPSSGWRGERATVVR